MDQSLSDQVQHLLNKFSSIPLSPETHRLSFEEQSECEILLNEAKKKMKDDPQLSAHQVTPPSGELVPRRDAEKVLRNVLRLLKEREKGKE